MKKMMQVWIAIYVVMVLAGCSSNSSKSAGVYLGNELSANTANSTTIEETTTDRGNPAATRLAMMNELQNLTPAEANEVLLKIETMEAKIASLEGESSPLTIRPTVQSQENPTTRFVMGKVRICPQHEIHNNDRMYTYEYNYETSEWATKESSEQYGTIYIGEKVQAYTHCQDSDHTVMTLHYYCTACGFDELYVIFHTNAASTLAYSGEYQGDLTPTALVTMRGGGMWTHTFQCCCENAPILPVTVTGCMYG